MKEAAGVLTFDGAGECGEGKMRVTVGTETIDFEVNVRKNYSSGYSRVPRDFLK